MCGFPQNVSKLAHGGPVGPTGPRVGVSLRFGGFPAGALRILALIQLKMAKPRNFRCRFALFRRANREMRHDLIQGGVIWCAAKLNLVCGKFDARQLSRDLGWSEALTPKESVILAGKAKATEMRMQKCLYFNDEPAIWPCRYMINSNKNNWPSENDQLFFSPRRQCEFLLNFACFDDLFAFFKSILHNKGSSKHCNLGPGR